MLHFVVKILNCLLPKALLTYVTYVRTLTLPHVLSFGCAADLDLYELDQKLDLDFGCDVEPDTVGRSISS